MVGIKFGPFQVSNIYLYNTKNSLFIVDKVSFFYIVKGMIFSFFSAYRISYVKQYTTQ